MMSTTKQELIFGINDLPEVVKMILNTIKNVQIITLEGTLGSGKTTFAIELLRQFGVQGQMQSPTYTYLQIYNNNNKIFYHFDLYRLSNKNDFLFSGFDEFLYQSDSMVIIEWPEIIKDLLDKNVCQVRLNYIDDVTRKIVWSYK